MPPIPSASAQTKPKKSRLVRKEIRLTPAQLRPLTKAAQKHHMPLSRFIPRAALAYCDEVFLCTDTRQIQDVMLSCREVCNALYHLAEKQDGLSKTDIRDATDMIGVLESAVLHILHHPPRLTDVLQEAFADPQLRHWITQKVTALSGA